MTNRAAYLAYWGKAQAPEGTDVAFHPLAYHSLDVAAVASALLSERPLLSPQAATLLSLNLEGARRLLVVLSALHDLGKFAPAFQAKAPECWPECLGPNDA